MRYLTDLLPKATDRELSMISEALDNNGIHDNIHRARYFWTQVLFETANFSKLKESLRYTTAKRIVAVFPRVFNLDGTNGKLRAGDYVSTKSKDNSEALANIVYMDKYRTKRGALGNVYPGDGYKFIGRGAMHLTGRANYTRASLDIYGDERLVDNPDLVSDKLVVAVDTAVWFWRKNKLNLIADQRLFTKSTIVVNGSDVTVPERRVTLEKITKIIENNWDRV